MLSLNNRQWKKFKIKELFTQSRGKESAPKQNKKGFCPLISETSEKNGLVGFVEPTKIFKGNAITISINFGKVIFYQHSDFCASVNIAILHSEYLNKFNSFFIIDMIKRSNEKYDYGYKTSEKRISNTAIMLPVRQDDTSSPDYDFMTDFIRERMDAKRQVYVNYCLDKLRRLESDLDDVLATECDDNLGCDDMTCEGAGDRV